MAAKNFLITKFYAKFPNTCENFEKNFVKKILFRLQKLLFYTTLDEIPFYSCINVSDHLQKISLRKGFMDLHLEFYE